MEGQRNDGGGVVRGLKWTAGVILYVAVLWNAGTWAGDTRYITRGEFQVFVASQEFAARRTAAAVRKDSLEDKIFDLDQIPDDQKTQIQRAVVNRARAQLQYVQTELMRDAK